MNNRLYIRDLLAATCLTLVASPGYAQEAPAQEAATANSEAQLQDIVVTAQKREENLNKVGITVAALGSEALDKLGVNQASDLAAIVPGFSYADSGLNTPIYTLRGIGFNETSLAASSTVSVYVDEVALPFPSTTKGAVLDLQRVEVVKGPQGTLYGQNTTAGAINYISNKPTDKLTAGFNAGYGRFDAVELGGYVSGPLTDSIRARIAANVEKADGWQVSQTRPNDRNGAIDKKAGRFIVDADLADTLKFSLTLSGWTDDGETQAPQLRGVDPEVPGNANPALAAAPIARIGDIRAADWDVDYDLHKDDRFWQAAGRFDWELSGGMKLTSITAYSDFKTRAGNEYDGTAERIFSFVTAGKIKSFAQELRLAGSAGDFVDWIVGGNYSRSKTRDTNSLLTIGTSANRPPAGTGVASAENFADQKIRTAAVFASADWKFTDQLKLTTGIRYTDFKARFAGCAGDTGDNTLSSVIHFVSDLVRTNSGLAPLPASAFTPGLLANGFCTTFVNPNGDVNLTATPGVTHDVLNENNVSWRAALNWQASRSLLLYASASQGYKAGSFPTIASTSFVQYTPAKQEKLIAYEAGVKATLFDRSLQFNAAAFYYDYKNKQLRGFFNDPTFATLSRLTNIPKSHVYGVEFDSVWLPFTGFRLTTSGSYIKTKIDEYSGLNSKGVQTDFAGGVLSFAPKWQANVDAEYDWAVGGNGLEAFIGGNYAYRSSASAVFGEDPRLRIPAYGLLGLRAGVGNKAAGWQLSAYGENVTNKYYLNNILPLFDTIKAYVGMPATYGIRFSYKFR